MGERVSERFAARIAAKQPSGNMRVTLQAVSVVGRRYRLLILMKESAITRLERLASLVAIAAVLSTGATAALAYTGQELVKNANVTLKEARAAALKAVPGQIAAEELEKEGGGSGLRYSFDIKLKGVTHEVGIDAKTGAVLENSIEGAKAD
ncbi:MAG: PepSY domain-containing protein [Stellaceae bacterium]